MSEVLCIGFGLGQLLLSSPCVHIMLVESIHHDRIRRLHLMSDISDTRAVSRATEVGGVQLTWKEGSLEKLA